MYGWLSLVLGCSSVSVTGTLVDGLTGAPIPGPMAITAKGTSPDTSLGCQFLSGSVAADGSFSIGGLCAGTGYTLDVDKEGLWLADGAAVPDGGLPGPMRLEAWSVPKGAGVYLRKEDGTLEELKTAADLKSEKFFARDEYCRYPWQIVPDNVPLLTAGQHLVLVGKNTVDEMTFRPVVPSGPRMFGTEQEKIRMSDWAYLSVRFTDDTTWEKVDATPDPAKVIVKRAEPRVVEWVAADALAPGRYALMRDGDRRMYLVDVGVRPPPTPKPPEAPVP